MVDERTMEKYRMEPKEASESLFVSFNFFAISSWDRVPFEKKRAGDKMLRSGN